MPGAAGNSTGEATGAGYRRDQAGSSGGSATAMRANCRFMPLTRAR